MEIVKRIQESEAKAGNETAKKLIGWIKRKTIKQTVMTQVYGVTQFGARDQIKGAYIYDSITV